MVLLAGIVLVSNAQGPFLLRGSVITSGAFQLRLEKEKQETGSISYQESHTAFSFNPFAGYFLMDDLALGLGVDVSANSYSSDDFDIEGSFTSISLGPVVRYYISEGLFAQGFFGVGSSNSSDTSGGFTSESKLGLNTWRVGAGYSIRLTETILLDPFVSYGSYVQKDKENSDNKLTRSGIWFGLSFTLIVID